MSLLRGRKNRIVQVILRGLVTSRDPSLEETRESVRRFPLKLFSLLSRFPYTRNAFSLRFVARYPKLLEDPRIDVSELRATKRARTQRLKEESERKNKFEFAVSRGSQRGSSAGHERMQTVNRFAFLEKATKNRRVTRHVTPFVNVAFRRWS